MRKINLENSERNTLARRVQYVQLAVLQQLQSRLNRLRKVNERLIVFEVFLGRKYTDSPRAIYEAMLADRRFRKYTFVWVFKEPEHYAYLRKNPRTKVVAFKSKEYRRTYRKAKYWVVNSMIPLSIVKQQKKQIMLQCWHGTPLKRLRNDVIENTIATFNSHSDLVHKNNLDARRYDYFISPSRYASDRFSTAFDLKELGKEDIIIETGYPRNDFLVNHTKADIRRIRTRLGLPKNKKVLLYAPTWRDDQYDAERRNVYTLPLDLDALREQLGDEYVVLVRLHYFVTDNLDLRPYEGFVYDVSLDDDINDLYVISDVLVTDYSSVFFDYANLKRPMLFYMYDKEHYEKELRGVYLPPDRLPGDVVSTQVELVERLQDLEAYYERTKEGIGVFHAEFNYLDDGMATQRVIDTVWPK